jgi:hypothetical protein
MRYALFWDITRRHVVLVYRRFGTKYRSHLQGAKSSRFWTLEDETDTLSRNVGKGLPLEAALYSRRAQISDFSTFTRVILETFLARVAYITGNTMLIPLQ